MMTIDHDTEHQLTSTTDHGHGCWETFAEEAVEKGLVPNGRHDDEVCGVTLWIKYLDAIKEGYCTREIGCPGGEEE